MTIIKLSAAFPSGQNWAASDVRAYMKDQTPLAVDTVTDVRDNDLEQTRFLYVKAKGAFYRLNLSSTAADDGDTVLRDNIGRRYEKQGGTGAVSSVNGQTGDVVLSIREKLTANRTYYVRTDGNDSNDGLANTSGGAFLTIQKAVDVVAAIDMAGFTATIQVGAGTYTQALTLKSLVGGFCIIVGDETTPSNVLLNVSGSCFTSDGVVGAWHVRGMKLQATTHAIGVTDGAIVKFQNIDFGVCSFYHMLATGGRIVATGHYTISGSANRHVYLFAGGSFQCQARTVTLSGSLAFAVFLQATTASTATVSGNTYSGSATGQRHNAQMNAVIQSAGGGANYFPGDAAGAVATGGQYG